MVGDQISKEANGAAPSLDDLGRLIHPGMDAGDFTRRELRDFIRPSWYDQRYSQDDDDFSMSTREFVIFTIAVTLGGIYVGVYYSLKIFA